ncbi:hypothetical protein OKW30_001422 [Paraburkholderia sp. Clong3]|uniref:hypothetical protein n=1 Tax=Paraburkholderia sp. Clong3 TaxID=2991061 RepID=UPI003D1FD83A
MKPVLAVAAIAAALLSLSTVASHAASPADLQRDFDRCNTISGLYGSIAQTRDMGADPQYAFDSMKGRGFGDGVNPSEKQLKNMINTVYFDQRFAHYTAHQIKMGMLDACLGRGPKPLK